MENQQVYNYLNIGWQNNHMVTSSLKLQSNFVSCFLLSCEQYYCEILSKTCLCLLDPKATIRKFLKKPQWQRHEIEGVKEQHLQSLCCNTLHAKTELTLYTHVHTHRLDRKTTGCFHITHTKTSVETLLRIWATDTLTYTNKEMETLTLSQLHLPCTHLCSCTQTGEVCVFLPGVCQV